MEAILLILALASAPLPVLSAGEYTKGEPPGVWVSVSLDTARDGIDTERSLKLDVTMSDKADELFEVMDSSIELANKSDQEEPFRIRQPAMLHSPPPKLQRFFYPEIQDGKFVLTFYVKPREPMPITGDTVQLVKSGFKVTVHKREADE